MLRSLMTVAMLGLATLGAQAAPPHKPVIADDVQCNGCVDQQDIAADAVGSSEIAQASVGESKLTAALLSRIAALEARSRAVQVLANGVPIGSFLGAGGLNSGYGYMVLSPKKYFFHVVQAGTPTMYGDEMDNVGDLLVATVYYTTADCSGQPWVREFPPEEISYSSSYAPSLPPAPTIQGFVVQESDDSGWMRHLYVPAGSQHQFRGSTGIITGRLPNGQCGDIVLHDPPSGYGSDSYFSALPNDPTVTGVPNERFQGPITIE